MFLNGFLYCFLFVLIKDSIRASQDRKTKRQFDDYLNQGLDDVRAFKNYNLDIQLLTHQRGDVDSEPGFDLTPEEMIKFKIWPRGVIPYFIDNYSYDKDLRDRIRSYLENVFSTTGLRFTELPKPPDDDKTRWVLFVNRRGVLDCVDYNTKSFTNEGVQKIVLGYDCLAEKGLSSVILALAGVPAQHNAPNRDDHITVHLENIMPEHKSLFDVLANDEWLFHDIAYDFKSSGHYHWHKYTSNGKATIKPKNKTINPLSLHSGETNKFSIYDILKIKALYNYITTKDKLNVSQCNKLFAPGVNFSYNTSRKEVKPRRKPSKYLGLSDDTAKRNEDGKNVIEDYRDEIKTRAFEESDYNSEEQKNNYLKLDY